MNSFGRKLWIINESFHPGLRPSYEAQTVI
jgi:hypothetical protein